MVSGCTTNSRVRVRVPWPEGRPAPRKVSVRSVCVHTPRVPITPARVSEPDRLSRRPGLLASSLHLERDLGLAPRSVESFEFGRRGVAERLVQARVVEPADVLDDG